MKRKHLFTWMGTADLRGIDNPDNRGPVATALRDSRYAVHLLMTPRNRLPERFRGAWDQYRRSIEEVTKQEFASVTTPELRSAMDWSAIMDAAQKEVRRVREDDPDGELTFFLSPGTSAMAAVWILLAKTEFPASLVESSHWETAGKASLEATEVPFDLVLRRRTEQGGLWTFEDIPDRNAPMTAALETARRAAETDVAILFHGETGSGKEVFAQAVHAESSRAGGRFLACNCAAFTPTLVESELFGHVKGAFTDAKKDRVGLFEAASDGTLFLDEVGELTPATQAKLLRVLEEGKVTPLGTTDERSVDVRIVAATNRDLKAMCRERTFREDLYYRLAPITIGIPPLRKRHADDRRAHLERELSQVNERFQREIRLEHGAWERLDTYRWPGNIREARNVMEYCAVIAPSDGMIRREHLNVRLDDPLSGGDPILDLPLEDCEDAVWRLRLHYWKRALEGTSTNKDACKRIGISTSTLGAWRKKWRERGLEE